MRHATREVVRKVRVQERDHAGDGTRHAERPEHEQHGHRDRGEREDVEHVHGRPDVAGHGAEHLQPDQIQVVEADREVEELLVERRAQVRVREEPGVVDPALREHFVEGRVRFVGVHAGIAARVRERNVEVGVPQLEHRHEDHQGGDRHQHRVEEQCPAVASAPRPIHGGTVIRSLDAIASRQAAVSSCRDRKPTSPRGSQCVCAVAGASSCFTAICGCQRCSPGLVHVEHAGEQGSHVNVRGRT